MTLELVDHIPQVGGKMRFIRSDAPPELRLVVAVPTFRRPATLAGLLARLPERVAEVEGARVEVLVPDNDPAGSARQVVRDAPLPVRYVVEPRPGIAAVRDRALDEAADADLLAFLDDDERPRERWLAALVGTWRDTGRPAAVMGRVISVFAHEPDPWLLATGVFRRRPRPTGLEIPVAASGNLLLDLRQVRSLGTRFDVTLGLAGARTRSSPARSSPRAAGSCGATSPRPRTSSRPSA